MLKIDAHSHAGEGAAKWSGQQVVDRMDTIGVDKTVIFPFTEGFFHNEDIPKYVELSYGSRRTGKVLQRGIQRTKIAPYSLWISVK